MVPQFSCKIIIISLAVWSRQTASSAKDSVGPITYQYHSRFCWNLSSDKLSREYLRIGSKPVKLPFHTKVKLFIELQNSIKINSKWYIPRSELNFDPRDIP